jgi:hypothetical protein
MPENTVTETETHVPLAGAGTQRIHYGLLWDRRLEEAYERGQGPTAVLVCHGMGQQVRYETISGLAEAIRQAAAESGGHVDPINVRLCSLGDDFLARAEVSWRGANGEDHSAHVYEAYWAPLTEGKVTYWDTVRFLLGAAYNGLRYSRPFIRTTFQRWMFGGPESLPIGRLTWFGIVAVLVFLALQVGAIWYVFLTLADQFKAALAQLLPGFSAHGFWELGLRLLSFFLPGIKVLFHPGSSAEWWTAFWRLLVWLLAIVEALAAKYFITEYVGDVAAYVSPYKDSKFDELRHQIQAVGLQVGKVIYGFRDATDSPVPKYKDILIVGHSLGSVLAYDTLNALINLDTVASAADKRDVMGKTRAMITFGSPLDKTAFIFRMQAKNQTGWIREQLAASVQPLIVSYTAYRPETFRWVNIWSPMDIISGSLDYYDVPPLYDPALPHGDPRRPDDPRRVQNKVDRQARIPLYAHVQYWGNSLLRKELYAFLTRAVPGTPSRDAARAGAKGSK